jgi:transcriptional regulator with XRE-family HTH domain
MSFGQRLRAIRERRDYTQAALAKVAKMDPSQVAHFEGDTREPSAENIRKLARAIDCRADYLLELSDDTGRINGQR